MTWIQEMEIINYIENVTAGLIKIQLLLGAQGRHGVS